MAPRWRRAPSDPDGDLFEILRRVAGPDVPIVSVFDLHANVSRRMTDNISAFVGYLENPHVDIYERGVEAAKHMRELLDGTKTAIEMVKIPLVPPQIALLTAKGPYADLIKYGQTKVGGDILNVSVMAGLPTATAPRTASPPSSRRATPIARPQPTWPSTSPSARGARRSASSARR